MPFSALEPAHLSALFRRCARAQAPLSQLGHSSQFVYFGQLRSTLVPPPLPFFIYVDIYSSTFVFPLSLFFYFLLRVLNINRSGVTVYTATSMRYYYARRYLCTAPFGCYMLLVLAELWYSQKPRPLRFCSYSARSISFAWCLPVKGEEEEEGDFRRGSSRSPFCVGWCGLESNTPYWQSCRWSGIKKGEGGRVGGGGGSLKGRGSVTVPGSET